MTFFLFSSVHFELKDGDGGSADDDDENAQKQNKKKHNIADKIYWNNVKLHNKAWNWLLIFLAWFLFYTLQQWDIGHVLVRSRWWF